MRASAALVALGVGVLAHAIVENPARFNPRLIRSRRLTYSMGAAITAVVLLVSIGLDGAATAASAAGPSVSLTAVAASARTFDCARQTHSPDGIAYCEDGDLRSHRSLLLVGDSHARHWVPAFARAARQEGVRLIVRWQSVCPAAPTPVITLQGPRNKDCDTFHAQTARLIQELRPTAVVTSDSATYSTLLVLSASARAVTTPAQAWGDAYQRYLASLRSMGIKVGSVVDTPRNASNPIDCLADHPAARCATPVSRALGPQARVADALVRARANLGGVPTLDVNSDLCDTSNCRVVANGTYVYVDVDHLYRAFVLTEVPRVETLITQVMR